MEHRLNALAPMPTKIVWHENRTTYLSAFKEKGRLHMRLHKLFYNAPTPVLEAVLSFALKRDRKAAAIIKQMAHLHFSQEQAPPVALKSAGSTYNLQEIYDRLKPTVPNMPDTSIGWSTRTNNGKFRSITFGTYDKVCRQIRINPLLDDPGVPLYFVEFIVYHEMLHAICPVKMDSRGRCAVHTKEFREKERQFPLFNEAKKWEDISFKFFKRRNCHGRS